MKIFTHLEIETIGSCNRSCVTCLRQTHVDGGETHEGRFPVSKKIGVGNKMPVDTFRRVIDEAIELGFTGSVCMQHFNEPLLDDRLEDLALYVRSRSEIEGDLTICTNADFVTDERAASLDEIFDALKITLYMDEPMKAAREAWLVERFKSAKLDFNRGSHIVTHFSPFSNLEDCKAGVIDLPCTRFNSMFIVAHDGTALHCCDDYSGHFGLGNVNDDSVDEIWNSDTHRSLVEDLSEVGGRKSYPHCASCPRY